MDWTTFDWTAISVAIISLTGITITARYSYLAHIESKEINHAVNHRHERGEGETLYDMVFGLSRELLKVISRQDRLEEKNNAQTEMLEEIRADIRLFQKHEE